MNRAARWISLIICGLGISRAAETMAYHFASEPALDKPLAKCPVLKDPPAATVFITAGDELRDLTGFFREKKIPLKDGWAIWNQTRRQLVVQAGMVDQWRVEQASGFGEQLRLARISVDWLRFDPADETSQAPPFASVAMIGNSSDKATAAARQATTAGDWSISIETETTLGESGLLNTRFSIAWQGPGGESGEQGSVATSLTLKDGRNLPFASWFAAGHGPASQLNARPDILLVDGSLWREARLHQMAGQAIPFRTSDETDIDFSLKDFPTPTGRKVKAANFSRESVLHLLPEQAPLAEDQDPFAEPPATPLLTHLPNFPEARIPADLSANFPRPMLDLQAQFQDMGLSFQDDDFAIYDPLSETLFVSFGKETEMDKAEALLMTYSCLHGPAVMESTIWLADGVAPDSPFAKATVLGTSGQIAKLRWNRLKDRPILSFEVEPVCGESGTMLDLRYDWIASLPGKQPESGWRSQSRVILANGIPLVSEAAKLPAGIVVKQGLKATIVDPATAPK